MIPARLHQSFDILIVVFSRVVDVFVLLSENIAEGYRQELLLKLCIVYGRRDGFGSISGDGDR